MFVDVLGNHRDPKLSSRLRTCHPTHDRLLHPSDEGGQPCVPPLCMLFRHVRGGGPLGLVQQGQTLTCTDAPSRACQDWRSVCYNDWTPEAMTDWRRRMH